MTDTPVAASGTVENHPPSNGSYFLRALVNGWLIDFGSGTVSVTLPVVDGKTTVGELRPDLRIMGRRARGKVRLGPKPACAAKVKMLSAVAV